MKQNFLNILNLCNDLLSQKNSNNSIDNKKYILLKKALLELESQFPERKKNLIFLKELVDYVLNSNTQELFEKSAFVLEAVEQEIKKIASISDPTINKLAALNRISFKRISEILNIDIEKAYNLFMDEAKREFERNQNLKESIYNAYNSFLDNGWLIKKANLMDFNYYKYLEEMKNKTEWFLNKISESKEDIPKNFDEIINKLKYVANKYGYKIYAVGGFVRDKILGKTPKDLDVLVIKEDEGIRSAINFARYVAREYGLSSPVEFPEFGVSKIIIDGNEVEFIIPRKEEYQSSSRKPKIEYGDLRDDSLRRDFTINALYLDLNTGKIIDPTGRGLNDIKNRVIRVTNEDNIDQIFKDDPLRILRAIRQSIQFGFELDKNVIEAIKRNVDRLDIVSKERIRDEFKKMLFLDFRSAAKLMKELGILNKILPELDKAFDVPHDSPHHKETIGEHILEVVNSVSPNLVDKLVALLHDISKPAVKKIVEDIAHFYEHEKVSAQMAREILTRLKFPNDIINEVVDRIEKHMRPHEYTKQWSDKAVRRFIAEMGENLQKILEFAEHDIKASQSEDKDKKLELLDDLKRRVEEQKSKTIVKPIISGDEIMQIFERSKGGIWVGKILNYVKELQLENPNITKDELIEKIKKYYYDHGLDKSSTTKIFIAPTGFGFLNVTSGFKINGSHKSKFYCLNSYFNSLEIQHFSSKVPNRYMFEKWYNETPKNFRFSFNCPKIFNPFIILKDDCDKIKTFFMRLEELKDKAGPIIITIPKGVVYEKGLMQDILDCLPEYQYVADIYDEDWINMDVYDALERNNVAILKDHIDPGYSLANFEYYKIPLGDELSRLKLEDHIDHAIMHISSNNSKEIYIVLSPHDKKLDLAEKAIKNWVNKQSSILHIIYNPKGYSSTTEKDNDPSYYAKEYEDFAFEGLHTDEDQEPAKDTKIIENYPEKEPDEGYLNVMDKKNLCGNI